MPRSFRPEGAVSAAHEIADTEASPAQAAAAVNTLHRAESPTAFGEQIARIQREKTLREEESPLATALGSWQDDLAAYKKKRQKLPTGIL